LRKIGLTEEQIKETLIFVKHVALDAVYASAVRKWADSVSEDQK